MTQKNGAGTIVRHRSAPGCLLRRIRKTSQTRDGAIDLLRKQTIIVGELTGHTGTVVTQRLPTMGRTTS